MRNKADGRLDRLLNKSKGDYITQGVSFNKNCERQMGLLRYSFEESASFSGLVKEMLAKRMELGEDLGNKLTNNKREVVLGKKEIESDWL